MADETLSLGYSPCPNDTFIFYALVHGVLPQA
ncbi:MAG: 1,4-dihydroxy-6-naphthoate synthase, partial [Candidatus Latescibacterota bacterium]|nr:1,4-dihydroxy-6-naphthoate synthase [Candidatus Latescibacterota bacterium]